ncbi:MAG: hydrogenase nickel incorporation protein HypB [Myxococcales bacterium]|nr:hydrogenase nickel incorporation protein HypB [Myxococcales bacterium]
MCETCGCDGDGATIHGREGTHTHVLPDGSKVTHSHGQASPEPDDAGRSHSHSHPQRESIRLEQRLLEKNEQLAERNRAFFLGRRLTSINLMSSPGSGKTSLLERTLREATGKFAVLEGDQETNNDAARIRATGVSVVQINTGKGCHLEADMVWHGVQELDPEPGTTLFIENVGNLVCPALFDLGERARVVLFSVTEGEDKPLKYPNMFRRAQLILLTKTDLLPYLDFRVADAQGAIDRIAPDARVLQLSTKSGDGLDAWYAWLEELQGPD